MTRVFGTRGIALVLALGAAGIIAFAFDRAYGAAGWPIAITALVTLAGAARLARQPAPTPVFPAAAAGWRAGETQQIVGLRQVRELHLLRSLERVVAAGHQPMKAGAPDHRWHVSGCDACNVREQLVELRRPA